MRRLDLASDVDKNNNFTTRGVVVFLPKLVQATYAFTQHKNDAGEVTGNCTPIIFDKLDIVPDTTAPYSIDYQPEWFSTHKFSVSVANGMLTAVNTESESAIAKTLESLASAASTAASIRTAQAAPRNGKPDCNTTQQLKAVKQVVIDK
jgi:hypothetical protein